MAIRLRLPFTMLLVGDGASTTITVPLASAAIGFNQVGGHAVMLAKTFDMAVSHPTGIGNVLVSSGIDIEATLDLTGAAIILKYGSPLGDGELEQLNGDFYF